MPNTLIPIQTYTLTSTASSVTFSNIPQNYTDLKIVYSGRDTTDSPGSVYIQFNGAGYNSTTTKINGTGSSVSSSSHNNAYLGLVPGPSQTANTFSNGEIYIPNYTSSTNKYFSSDVVNENDAQAAAQFLWTGLWANTAAITSVTLKTDQAFAVNSKFTLYGISNGVKATGGTLTVAGGYAYHTFTSTGSFLPSQKIKNAEVLVVAGGGGGGADRAGGGGAGGVFYQTNLTLNAGNSYTALCGSGGAGGAGNTNDNGANGTDSIFFTAIAKGGGGGAGGSIAPSLSGGSGGGGSGTQSGSTGPAGGSSTQSSTGGIGYGNAGGVGGWSSSLVPGSGGGGGAGSVGQNAVDVVASGNGGAGTSAYSSWHSITGTGVLSSGLYYIAGGGGAGKQNQSSGGAAGTGGVGGGANGASSSSSAVAPSGTANTGGGGGGAANSPRTYGGGTGGSGLIIVRYPLNDDIPAPTVNVTSTVTPLPVSGATLWLDASNTSSIIANAGSVLQWNDLSGNGYHFAQLTTANQPTTGTRTINSKNVIDFDGTNDKLVSVGPGSIWSPFHNATGATLFTVISMDVNQDQPILTTSNDTTQIGMWFYTRSSTTDFAAAILNGTSNNFVSLEYGGSATYTANTPLVVATVWDASNATTADRIKYYKNSGSELGTFGQSSVNYTTSNAANPMYMGAWPLSNAFNGVIAEVIMYPGILSDTNRNAVSNYLKTKWGI